MSQLVIYPSDLTPVHCAWGLRYWFKLHGLDFKKFLEHGIAADDLLATKDLLAIEAVERKRAATVSHNG